MQNVFGDIRSVFYDYEIFVSQHEDSYVSWAKYDAARKWIAKIRILQNRFRT